MALSNAERQKRYRENRKLHADDRRLNLYVDYDCHMGLHRLAAHFDMTMKELLRHMVRSMEKSILDSMEWDDKAINDFYQGGLDLSRVKKRGK